MATKFMSSSEVGKALGLSRDQMIYRLRRNEIRNQRMGWNWLIPVTELERVPTTDWYKSSKKVEAA